MPIDAFVGLGNPGLEYIDTRHNVGFRVIDRVCAMFGGDVKRSKFSGLWGEVRIGKDRIYVLKPQTYMNRSGESVRKFVGYFKIPPANIVVVHDDLDLPLGRIKLVRKGGAGGHKGVRSIIEALGTEHFPRMKIGIGRPRHGENVEKFVLGPFYPDEREAVEEMIEIAAEGLVMVVEKGLDHAMNVINARKPACIADQVEKAG